MKKLLALLMAALMVLSVIGCGSQTKVEDPQEPAVQDDAQADAEEPADEEPAEEPVEEEPVEEEPEEEEVVVVEEGDEDWDDEEWDEEEGYDEEFINLGYEDEKFYTALHSIGTSPSTWNMHTWQTNDDGYIMDYITSNLYVFDFDMEHPEYGYIIVPEMAADMPEDITQELVGDEKWNIPEDAEEAYAYRIPINELAVWEDGTPITAHDYVYSMKALLDPQMQNHRADMYYTGTLVISKAKDYVYAGQTQPVSLSEFARRNGFESVDEMLEEYGDEEGQIDWAYSFGEWYNAEEEEWSYEEIPEGKVASGMTLNEMKEMFYQKVHEEWGESEETATQFFNDETFIDYTFPEVSFDEVGLYAEDDHNLVLVMEKPLAGFYFYYYLGDWLVNEEMYEANRVQKEGEELVTSTYMTSVDTTISHGPYKLTEFQDDKVIVMERNENWYGYHDGKHEGMYQTDKIYCQVVKEQATRFQMFLSGQLDSYGLDADQVADYRGSDYIYFTLSDYTACLNLNAQMGPLEARQEPGINKTVITIPEFRRALSWSIDRADMAATTTASNSAGFGLLNEKYIADVENMIPYRYFDAAKQTLIDVYGLEYGEGKDYATLDEAYDAMTGYDLDGARELFDVAYDIAIEEGLLEEDDIVQLSYYAAEDNENVRKLYNYYREAYEKAVEGTKFEGKLELVLDATAGNEFGTNFRNGLGDMMVAGWLGATFNPFYLISAYLSDNYRYSISFDINQKVTYEVNGEEITLPLMEWYNAMMGDHPDYHFGPDDADMETRVGILAMIEGVVLEDYTSIPMMYSSSAHLKSQKIEYLIEEENEIMGRGGGVKYLKYNFSDDEWEEYIQEQGGELDYK